jgi:predicted AAA+ superfamily ATPase
MEELFQISNNLVKKVAIHFERSLVNKINWNARLIEIRGARGVGKTTLLLQQIKKQFGENPQTGLYISLDDPYFYENSLVELAETFIKYGGVQLFIDEVHRYTPKYKESDWSKEIKIIYDRYPGLKIVYTGSSTLELYHGHGDLSRRRSTYVLNGLSFREYLEFNEILTFAELALKEIVLNHTIIANDLIDKTKILKHFRDYIQIGYFPFYQEDPHLIIYLS